MSVKNATFGELQELTFALIGRNYESTSAAFGRIVSLFNQGAKRAYRASNYWERYLLVGEPRTVTSGSVPSSQESYIVSISGLEDHCNALSGTYIENGTENGNKKYSLFKNGEEFAKIYASGAPDYWVIASIENGDKLFSAYTSSDVATTGWFNSGCADDTDALADSISVSEGTTSEIDTFLRIYKQAPFSGNHVQECDFYVKDGSAKVMGSSNNANLVFVTHKKALDVDLASTDASSTAIPEEFMPYMAHYAAYTWQRSVEQNASENNFALSLGIVNQVLEDELAKIEAQGVFNTNVARKFKTYRNT